jgi:hypothetical protein
MTPEQWTLAERLYHEAASIAVADRDSWLARACGGDEIVRREVESLLAQDTSRTGVFDGHALDLLTRDMPADNLVGRTLAGYEFRSLIDEGGMGNMGRAGPTGVSERQGRNATPLRPIDGWPCRGAGDELYVTGICRHRHLQLP